MKYPVFWMIGLMVLAGVMVFVPLYYFQHTIDTAYLAALLFFTISVFLIDKAVEARGRPTLRVELEPPYRDDDGATQSIKLTALRNDIPSLKVQIRIGGET